jgi:hypothetical protein
MTQLSNLLIGDDFEGANEDTLPGSGRGPLDTGLYPMTVELAYLDKSSGGAQCVHVTFKEYDGERRLRITEYVSAGDAKGNATFYWSNGKKRPLPGLDKMNQLALVTTGKQLGNLEPEQKTVKLMNWDTRQEEPTQVSALTQMMGQEVLVGVVKNRENKRARQSDGSYAATNEERVFADANKFFTKTGHTIAEKAANVDADFVGRWQEKFPTGYVRDTYEAQAGSGPAASPAPATGAAVKSVFG